MMNGSGKSPPVIVAVNPANSPERSGEEWGERRAGTEEKAFEPATPRTLNRPGVPQGLERLRQAARPRRKWRFTALPPHIDPALLAPAFCEGKRAAAVGGDGMTWRAYEADLASHLVDLHTRVHRGS